MGSGARTSGLERARLLLRIAVVAVSASTACSTPDKTSAPDRAPASAPSGVASGATSGSGAPPGEPELVAYGAPDAQLRGYLYRPAGTGPFPAMVFNHGSEKDPGTKLGQAAFYVSRGYVLFVPHRRGQGSSGGTYVMDVVDAAPPTDGGAALAAELAGQVDDVAAAVGFVRSLSFVKHDAIAIAGASFGGIVTLLAAERDLGIRAAIDCAGASITWKESPRLRDRMLEAARHAKVPVFFFQAENDYDTEPSRALSAAMDEAGRPRKMKIYPPVGTSPDEGHGFCAGGRDPGWGEDALAFLRDAMPGNPPEAR